MTEQEIKKLAIEKFKKMVKEKEFFKVNYTKGYSFFTKKKWKSFIKLIREQSENFTEKNIELVKPIEAERITNMSFSVRRYYRQKFSDGSLGKITMNSKIMELDMKMLNFPKNGAVYSFKEEKYNCLRQEVLKKYVYSFIDLKMGEENPLEKDLVKAVEAVYRRVNEASLFNYPEELANMVFSDWNILESEEVDIEKDLDKQLVLRFKHRESYIKIYIGKFTIGQKLDLIYDVGGRYGLDFYDDEGGYLPMKYQVFKGLQFKK